MVIYQAVELFAVSFIFKVHLAPILLFLGKQIYSNQLYHLKLLL